MLRLSLYLILLGRLLSESTYSFVIYHLNGFYCVFVKFINKMVLVRSLQKKACGHYILSPAYHLTMNWAEVKVWDLCPQINLHLPFPLPPGPGNKLLKRELDLIHSVIRWNQSQMKTLGRQWTILEHFKMATSMRIYSSKWLWATLKCAHCSLLSWLGDSLYQCLATDVSHLNGFIFNNIEASSKYFTKANMSWHRHDRFICA